MATVNVETGATYSVTAEQSPNAYEASVQLGATYAVTAEQSPNSYDASVQLGATYAVTVEQSPNAYDASVQLGAAFTANAAAGSIAQIYPAHAPRHHQGGADEIDAADLGGASGGAGEVLTADGAGGADWSPPGTPGVHASTHEDGGVDEIDVTDLSGLLADAQTPLAHASTHEDGGTDEIDVTGLSGVLADAQTPLSHASTHEDGGSDEIDVTDLSGLLADAQTPLAHAASHSEGGSDEIDVADLGSDSATGARQFPASDGAGGVDWLETERVYTFGVENPISSDDIPRLYVPQDFEVREILALKVGGGAGSFDWELRHDADASNTGAGTLIESDAGVTNNTTGVSYTPPFDPGDPTVIPAGDWVWLELPTVSTGLNRPLAVMVQMIGVEV